MTLPAGFTTRPELQGSFGMVAASHWLAAQSGMAMLERGGNAFDAAAAAGFVLQVVEPHQCGPGGEAPMVLWSANEQQAFVVDGQGPAPAAATAARFADLGLELVPGTGLLAACVPGALGAWLLLLERFGTMPLAEVLEPALGYARHGFPVLASLSQVLSDVNQRLATSWPTTAQQWLAGGVPLPRSRLRNEQLAHTYERILSAAAAAGASRERQLEAARRAVYDGFVAEAIGSFAGRAVRDELGVHAGLLAADDLAGWRASLEAPARGRYRDVEVLKTGPWGQGPVLLQQLAILDPMDLDYPDVERGARGDSVPGPFGDSVSGPHGESVPGAHGDSVPGAHGDSVSAPHGYRVSGAHGDLVPASGGGSAPVALGAVAPGWRASAALVHVLTEVAKLALADREAFYGDPRFVEVPLAELCSPGYADERRQLIGDEASLELRPGRPGGREPRLPAILGRLADRAGEHVTPGSAGTGSVGAALEHGATSPGATAAPDPAGAGAAGSGGDTCHVDVVDRFGNMISATPSGGWLQASPTIPGLGFCLGTRAQMFWLEQGLPNSLAPGKRPRTTLSPGLVLRDGAPILAFGTPGGDQQDQWTVPFLLYHLDLGLGLQAAIDAANWHTTHLPSSFYPRRYHPGELVAEETLGEDVLAALAVRGHRVTRAAGFSLGRVTAVGMDGRGTLTAGADPRFGQAYASGR